jgi:hypothetical protein
MYYFHLSNYILHSLRTCAFLLAKTSEVPPWSGVVEILVVPPGGNNQENE